MEIEDELACRETSKLASENVSRQHTIIDICSINQAVTDQSGNANSADKDGHKLVDAQKSSLARRESIIPQSFRDILMKSFENSIAFQDFRHNLACSIKQEYCSNCRCDDKIFIFLYIIFGITYICSGVFGLNQCNSDQNINIFLITAGILSAFVYPVTVMEWTVHVGGCAKKGLQARGLTYIAILAIRMVVTVSGSVVMTMRMDQYPRDRLVCNTIFTLLEIEVVSEWVFIISAVMIPLLFYISMYLVARRLK